MSLMLFLDSMHFHWGIVQRQDTWLWTMVSGFESLSPSHIKED